MALKFTRRKVDQPPAGAAVGIVANDGLVRQLQAHGDARMSGVVIVTDRRTDREARIYLHEGGMYSIWLDGYAVPVAARLASAGTLDQARLRAIDDIDPDRSSAGPRAVEEGWIDVEALGAMHQEFLLASLGSIVTMDRAKVRAKQGLATSFACCVPVPPRLALDSVQVRRDRLAADASALATALGIDLEDAGLPPADRVSSIVLEPTGHAVPASLRLPEFAAFTARCDGARGLDEAASLAGFTRAEAVHVARILAANGVLGFAGWVGPDPEGADDVLLVPEQFPGHRVAAEARPAHPPGELTVPPAGVTVPPAEVTVPPAEVNEPAMVVDDEPVEPVNDVDVDVIRAELAAAERRAAELRERLAQAERQRG